MGQIITFPKQRRRYARVAIAQPVALVHDNATVATSMATNISLGGLQVLCDRYTSDSLHPAGAALTPETAPRIDAHFRLPLAHGLVKLDIECRLAYVVELEDGCHAVGLEFLSLDPRSRSHLMTFLHEACVIAGA